MTSNPEEDFAELVSDFVATPSKAFAEACSTLLKHNPDITDADFSEHILRAAVAFAARTLSAVMHLNPDLDAATVAATFNEEVVEELETVRTPATASIH
jgi:hypothetical protein